MISPSRRTPTALVSAGQSSICRRTSTARDTRPAMKQIFPPEILGTGFAAGGSVLDHNFGKSDPYTLGVEEEYMLLDGETLDLVQHVEAVLAATAGHELEEQVNPELMQSVLEIATLVCSTPEEVEVELRKLRSYVVGLATDRGMRVGSAGTHPFSLFERQRITARDRYRHLVDQLQYVARRELIFGLHIHVAVDEADKAVQIVNGLLAHLSHFLALSASSPFWRGDPTGLASSRQMVFAAFPRSGPPPREGGEDHLAERARNAGRWTSRPLTIWTARSGSSTATWMCSPKINSRRATYWSWSTRWWYRSRAVIRWRSKRLNGCVPAEPRRMPRSRAIP